MTGLLWVMASFSGLLFGTGLGWALGALCRSFLDYVIVASLFAVAGAITILVMLNRGSINMPLWFVVGALMGLLVYGVVKLRQSAGIE